MCSDHSRVNHSAAPCSALRPVRHCAPSAAIIGNTVSVCSISPALLSSLCLTVAVLRMNFELLQSLL